MQRPFSRLTKNAVLAISHASFVAERMHSTYVEPVHLFISLLLTRDGISSRVFAAMQVDIKQTVESLAGGVDLSHPAGRLPRVNKRMSEQVRDFISRAFSISREHNHVYVGTEHMLLAILEDRSLDFVKDLVASGVRVDEIKSNILNFTAYPQGVLSKPAEGQDKDEPGMLDALGIDLTAAAKAGQLDPIIGRKKELDQIVNILSRRKKNNPIIVGEAGVGKTAVVEGLAQKIVLGEVPESLRDAKLISLDVTSIVAGSKMRGDMEEKMMAVIAEVSSSPNTIVFIDEIHNVLGAGMISGGGLDLAGILKPALVHGNFRCIGATTLVDYNRYFEEDPALTRRFQKVLLNESSVDDTIKILKRMRSLLEDHHGVVISDEAIEYAVRLSDQYVSDRYLPDKAIDLMDEAAAARRIEMEGECSSGGNVGVKFNQIVKSKDNAIKNGDLDSAAKYREQEEELKKQMAELRKQRARIKKNRKYQVDADIVRKTVSNWTGIPLTTLGAEESSKLLRLEGTLGTYVVGQEEAVRKVSDAIKRARTGIIAGDRPWASFLFLGPTGVGKSELARVLTKTLFGTEDRLIQIDMSEMMEMHSVSKLIGSPPGYVGYREGGQLTEQVRSNPHSVILFDEVEKAHPDVLNILLQILENGHLTDGKGRRVNFKNTVVILTSNIGAEEIRRDKVLGFQEKEEDQQNRPDKEIVLAYDDMKSALEKELKETVRPELLNRLDEIVIFRSLTRKDASDIVALLLDELNARLKSQRVSVELNARAKSFLVEKGFSEEYGARPLRRTIQDYVETPVANYLLKYGGGVVWKGEKRKSIQIKKLQVVPDQDKSNLIVKKESNKKK